MKNRIVISLRKFHLSLFYFLIFLPQLLFSQTQADTISNSAHENNTIQVPYEEIELDCLCIRKNKYIVIRSYEQMISLFKHANDLGCRKFSPTVIDFEKEVIIGFHALLGRAAKKIPKLDIIIEEITDQEKTSCKVTVIDYPGGGKMLHPINIIIIFPVKSSDWDVEVEIIDYKNRFKQTNKSCYE